MGKKNSRSTGWAKTRKFPHTSHPAFYRWKNSSSDDISYVTFTHSNPAKINNEYVETVPLKTNIRKTGDNSTSHVVPRVYEGKRSSLGKRTDEYRIAKEDQPTIDKIFKTAPRYPVPKKNKKNDNDTLPF